MKKLILLVWLGVFLCLNCSPKKTDVEPQRPGQMEVLLNEGCVYLNTGELDKAEVKFNLVLLKEARNTLALNGMGLINLNRQKYDEAIKYFNQILQYEPQYTDVHNSLGIVYIEKGDFELAKEHLIIAANTEGYRTRENAYLNLANMEFKRNMLDDALRYIEKGIELNRAFAPLFNLKGMIQEAQGKLQDALDNFEKALRLLEGENVVYLINVGRVNAKLGNRDQALDYLEKAIAKAPSPEMRKQIKDLIAQVDLLKQNQP